jgi:hypothetical protein
MPVSPESRQGWGCRAHTLDPRNTAASGHRGLDDFGHCFDLARSMSAYRAEDRPSAADSLLHPGGIAFALDGDLREGLINLTQIGRR